MINTIRVLTTEDYHLFAEMDTGIEEDYIKLFFDRFTTGTNRLYGLFVGSQLASIGGYSVFARRYAMLGRMRSDRHFQGKSLSTELMSQIKQEALQADGVEWVGANTEEHNQSARRVLEKIGCSPRIFQYAATATDVSILETGANIWKQVHSLEQKKTWLEKTYLMEGNVFPYQCYYPFPASKALFEEDVIKRWSFFENDEKNRFVIVKHDQKKTNYLHVAYPWDDFASQVGFWETITIARQQLADYLGEETYVWIDLAKEEAASLPANHPFLLSSIWVLYEAIEL